MILTPDDVRDIVRVLDTSSVDELHVETADFAITLRRGDTTGMWSAESDVLREPRRLEVAQAAPMAPDAAHAPDVREREVREGLHAVTPPLLGTFYRAPAPGAPPFVDVGSRVEPDTVVGIVETMKMMNSVAAGASGTVAEIRIGDAQFADADAVLMLIEVDR
jgi:acetyl-CoA carboxylase biotin carboxyl carrier protein